MLSGRWNGRIHSLQHHDSRATGRIKKLVFCIASQHALYLSGLARQFVDLRPGIDPFARTHPVPPGQVIPALCMSAASAVHPEDSPALE